MLNRGGGGGNALPVHTPALMANHPASPAGLHLRGKCGLCSGAVRIPVRGMSPMSHATIRTGMCPPCMAKSQRSAQRFSSEQQYEVRCVRCEELVVFFPSEFKSAVIERRCFCVPCWDDSCTLRKRKASSLGVGLPGLSPGAGPSSAGADGVGGAAGVVGVAGGKKRVVEWERSEARVPGCTTPVEPPSKRSIPTIVLVTSSDEEWEMDAADIAALDAAEARETSRARAAMVDDAAEDGEVSEGEPSEVPESEE